MITDRHATAGRDLAFVIDDALRGAMDVPGPQGQRCELAVQLRDKDLGGAALYRLAAELRAVTAAHKAALYINGRLDVAMAVGAEGVHLGHGALPVSHVLRLAPHMRVGISTHDLTDVDRAYEQGVSFAVFGPVFDTPSKQGLLQTRGLRELTRAAQTGLPVLALGGVDPNTVSACRAAGASGVACIRAVLSAPSPARATVALLTRFFGAEAPRVG